jgi:peptide chain release factor 3
VHHVRDGKEMKIPNALTFMANERVRMEHAFPGDIIGIYNHGQLHIGDSLTEGEKLGFTGIPYFAPELFRSARSKDPLKAKQLHKGLKELGEEGAIQVFEDELGNLYLGAVGPLQFEIVAQRLATEYNVDAIYENTPVSTARWLTYPDEKTQKDFEREQTLRMAKDADGNPVYLATSIYNLQTTQKHWPDVSFHTTREHGQILKHSA